MVETADVVSMQFPSGAKWCPSCPKCVHAVSNVCPSVVHAVFYCCKVVFNLSLPGGHRLTCSHEIHVLSNLSAVVRMPLYMLLLGTSIIWKKSGGVWSIIGQDGY